MPKPTLDYRATKRKHPWPMVRLGDVCEVLDSRRVPISKTDRVGGNVPYYGATGVVDYVNDFIFDERLVLLGEDGAKWGAGDKSAFVIEGKSWVNNHVHVLRPKLALVDSFLVWYLNYADLGEYITGVTVPKLNQQRMGQIALPLPPLSEQKEIVARLERELAAVEKMKKGFEALAETAKAEFKAELKEVFEGLKSGGVEMWRIGDVCVNLDSRRIPITKADRKPGEYPYYGASGIVDSVDNYIFDGDYLLVSEDGANLLARTTPIAFSVSGKIWVNNHAHILSFAEIDTQHFVEYFFASISVAEYVTGAAQPKLTQSALNDITLPLPALSIQRRVVGCLSAAKARAEKLEAKAREGVAVCETMRMAILKEAFE